MINDRDTVYFLVMFPPFKTQRPVERKVKADSIMLATIRDIVWNGLGMKHINQN